MAERRKIRTLAEELLRWYQAHHRRLPWRGTKDPYKIWVSEVMLQQTTVQAVLPYYRRWLGLFPDIKALARAPIRQILKAWQGLGYYQRAKNLHLAARMMAKKFAGQIPRRGEDLLMLPGFGPYTTAAVLSIAFGQPYPVLDANVRRVVMRLTGIKGKTNSPNNKALLSYLQSIFPERKAGAFNQAMMELGALVCKPRNPLCLLCPLPAFCLAFQRGEQEVIPRPKKQRYQRIETVVAIIQEGEKYLIQKRPSTGLLADLWEFPGGKRVNGETLEEALRREVREEVGVEVKSCRLLLQVRHAYTQFLVKLYAYECTLEKNSRIKGEALRWVKLRALRQYPFPSGSAKIVTYLENRDSVQAPRAVGTG